MSSRLLLVLGLVLFPSGSTRVAGDELPKLLVENFEQGHGRWTTTDPDASDSVWRLEKEANNGRTSRFFRVTKASSYEPPFRSPHSIALLKDFVVSDFQLTARVQNTNPSAGNHRDLCLFWGYQDPAHFYYVHLGARPDPHSCQIFVVDGAPRTKITERESQGTPWTDDWHHVKVVRRVDDGSMEVYFDDLQTPCMTARDKRFAWGQVGIGTFDDSGNFDDIELVGRQVERSPLEPLVIGVRPAEHGAAVEVDGKPFADYRIKSGHQPILWPLYAPSGRALTRSWPMGPQLEHEHDDHPHHRSLWFNHGDVNGVDFWSEGGAGRPDAQIAHREFVRLEGGRTTGAIVSRNDWTADGKKVLEDQRTWIFGADRAQRWIDATLELKATNGPVTFGDTKEGSFGVRVAGTMKVDEKLGGKIVNSSGQNDAQAWGQPANWVDYFGPVEGATAGIAMLSHPKNFRPNCRWHVRTYGLFAANPFGKVDFPPGEPQQGALTLAAGETLVLRYRVLLHDGRLSADALAAAYDDYVDSTQP